MKKASYGLLILLTFSYLYNANCKDMANIQEEIWKDIPEYEGLYQASNFGRIKSLKRKGVTKDKILKLGTCQGYLHCHLSKGKRQMKTISAHKLIAITFIGPKKQGTEVNHKNGIRNDNRVENLEWITHQENILHAFRSGLKSQEGEKCPRAILNEKKVLEIRAMKGSMPYSAIGKIYGVHKSTIKNIVSRRQWDHI